MAYIDVADMAANGHLRERIAACAVTEGVRDIHPRAWADAHQWWLAASPGWSAAWEYARASDNPDPGRDGGVISDGMILAAVQARIAETAAPDPVTEPDPVDGGGNDAPKPGDPDWVDP